MAILSPILALLAAFCWSSSLALTHLEFSERIKSNCYADENHSVLGQRKPLSNTLENFISLVEKIEDANPHTPLKEELFFLLRRYTIEHLQFDSNGLPEEIYLNKANHFVVKTLWEPDEGERKRQPDDYIDPLSKEEKCSLFFMMSRTLVLAEPNNLAKAVPYYNMSRQAEGDFYPQEQGVVAVHDTNQAISPSRVVAGLYAGLLGSRRNDRTIQDLRKDLNLPEKKNWERPTHLDRLYAVTMAEVLLMSAWPDDKNGFLKDGNWEAPGENTKEVCPIFYKVQLPDEKQNVVFSYSALRGAADGLLLGLNVDHLPAETRLSQILRTYYGRSGKNTFCERLAGVESVKETLKEQMQLFSLLVSKGTEDLYTKLHERALSYYESIKEDVLIPKPNTELSEFCATNPTIENPEKLPLETPSDVLVIMETGNVENLKTQRLIIGHLAKRLATGSRFTVMTDQRGTDSEQGLRAIVNDTPNMACAACLTAQMEEQEEGETNTKVDKVTVVRAIEKILQDKRKQQMDQNGVPAKVVVIFDFDKEETQDAALIKALNEFHLNNRDVVVYAVGSSTESVLLKYARNDEKRVLSAFQRAEAEIGNDLYSRIAAEPAILQYSDCKTGRNEATAVFKHLVNPNTVQHWTMPPIYFYKSHSLKILFEPTNNKEDIEVCYSRATSKSSYQRKTCYNTTAMGGAKRLEFKDANPCKGFNEINCASFYFSILGIKKNPVEEIRNNHHCISDNEFNCTSLDQIKFKVSHEGIRCSGCFNLLSMPFLVLAAVFASLNFFRFH